MTITPAQYATVTVPEAWVRVPCTCDSGWITRGLPYPTQHRACAGTGHVYTPRKKVAL